MYTVADHRANQCKGARLAGKDTAGIPMFDPLQNIVRSVSQNADPGTVLTCVKWCWQWQTGEAYLIVRDKERHARSMCLEKAATVLTTLILSLTILRSIYSRFSRGA